MASALDIILHGINNNRYLWGISMLGVNVGGRAIIGDLNSLHPTLFDTTVAKSVVAFCMFFMASRDALVSTTMSVIFMILTQGLLNPGFQFSLLPSKQKDTATQAYNVGVGAIGRYVERQNFLHEVQK